MSTWSRYITEFVSYLKIEKGLSSNSIIAYTNDTNKLKNYCEDNNLSVKESLQKGTEMSSKVIQQIGARL